jgi:hypothetical protein
MDVSAKLIWVYEDYSGKSILSNEIERLFFLASIFQCMKFYPSNERILFCTENIKKEVESLDLNLFDRIDTELLSIPDGVDRNLFPFSPKTKVIREISSPFAILDCDFYLLKKLDFSGRDLVISHLEDEEFYQFIFKEGQRIFKKVGIEPSVGRRAYNVSFLYIENENFRKKYSDKAWDWMTRLSGYNWNGDWIGGYSHFCEQKLLYDMSVENNLGVVCLAQDFKNNKNFVHLGEEKRTGINLEYRLEQVKKIISDFMIL